MTTGPAFRRTVVGYDGEAGGRDALALAHVLSGKVPGELTLVRVASPHRLLHDVAPDAIRRMAEERRRALEEDVKAMADQVGAASRMVLADTAAGGLDLAARELEATLLVVGSSRRSRVGQILAGGVGLRLLHGAPCAVALAPAGYAHSAAPLAAIGVGYEGSAEADAALELAVRLALERDAALELVSVASDQYVDERWELLQAAQGKAFRAEQLGQLLQSAVESLPTRLAVSHALVHGDPIAVLAERAAELDLLVLGSRRHEPLSGVLLGSVSAELALSVPAPLLVVPRR